MRQILTRFATGGVGLLRTRLELATIELAQQRDRLLLRLGLIVGGVLALLFGTLGLGAYVVLYFWETDRLIAILAVAAVFIVLGAILLFLAIRSGRRDTSPFEATIAEFRKDVELLRDVLGREGPKRGSP